MLFLMIYCSFTSGVTLWVRVWYFRSLTFGWQGTYYKAWVSGVVKVSYRRRLCEKHLICIAHNAKRPIMLQFHRLGDEAVKRIYHTVWNWIGCRRWRRKWRIQYSVGAWWGVWSTHCRSEYATDVRRLRQTDDVQRKRLHREFGRKSLLPPSTPDLGNREKPVFAFTLYLENATSEKVFCWFSLDEVLGRSVPTNKCLWRVRWSY